MREVLVNRLGGLSLPRKSVVRLNDRPDMTLEVYRGRKTIQQQPQLKCVKNYWLKGSSAAPHQTMTVRWHTCTFKGGNSDISFSKVNWHTCTFKGGNSDIFIL